MKTNFILFFLLCFSINTFAQEEMPLQEKYTAHNKGKFFVSWVVTEKVTANQMLTLEGKVTTLQ